MVSMLEVASDSRVSASGATTFEPMKLVADVVALSPITPHASSLAAAADAFLDHADVAATAPPMT